MKAQAQKKNIINYDDELSPFMEINNMTVVRCTTRQRLQEGERVCWGRGVFQTIRLSFI